MEQEITPRQGPPEIPPLGERIARLEVAAMYDRSAWQREVHHLMTRISTLEKRLLLRRPMPIAWDGWLKVILTILLPLTVLALTGSLEEAASVARRVGGH